MTKNQKPKKLNYNFTGEFIFKNSSNLDSFLQEQKIGYLRKLGSYQSANNIIIKQKSSIFYNLYIVDTDTTFIDAPFSFQNGIKFPFNRLDDNQEVNSVVDIIDNEWIQKIYDEPVISVTWTFLKNELKITTSANEVTMTRFYSKKEHKVEDAFSIKNVFGVLKDTIFWH